MRMAHMRDLFCLDWVSLSSLEQNRPKVVDFAYSTQIRFLAYTTQQRLLVAYSSFHFPFLPYNGNSKFQLEISCLEKKKKSLHFLIFLTARCVMQSRWLKSQQKVFWVCLFCFYRFWRLFLRGSWDFGLLLSSPAGIWPGPSDHEVEGTSWGSWNLGLWHYGAPTIPRTCIFMPFILLLFF